LQEATEKGSDLFRLELAGPKKENAFLSPPNNMAFMTIYPTGTQILRKTEGK
jgi:hypothetical protein